MGKVSTEKNKVQKCSKCNAGHKANCLNVTKFECVGCRKYFSRRDSLQKHRKKCSRIKSLDAVCAVLHFHPPGS